MGSGSGTIPLVKHEAVLVKLETGEYYVIEKGGSYANNGNNKLIVKSANNLGSKMGWKMGDTLSIKDSNIKVGTLTTAGSSGKHGINYNVLTDNCWDA